MEARPLVHLDEPKALSALDDDVETAVVEALEHLGHRSPCADGAQTVLVGEDEPELASRPRGTA